MKDPGDGTDGGMSAPAPAGPEDALLASLFAWREQLARSIARENIGMRSSRIEHAVNRQVFSLLALALAEDRGILISGTLRAVVEGTTRWEEVLSGLGDPWAGTGEECRAGDPVPATGSGPVQTFAGSLVSRDRPYDLAAIPLASVAAVLDRYLTRMIRRSAPHHAIVVDRPDAGTGLAGAPPALAEYAVERTLAAACNGRSPFDPLPLRIIDPACGAGRMLLEAFVYLKNRGGEPEEILRDTIHGIDPNPHAIAAARVMLTLAACEGRAAPFVPAGFFAAFRGNLAILTGTIRCGNGLVGPAIADDESWAFCPPRERHAIRPFAWEEQFPEILLPGGFDAVISAPPDRPVPDREWLRRYFQRHYAVYDPEAGRSAYVIEKGLAVLRPSGVAGIITGSRWLHGRSGTTLRTLVLSRQPEEIVTAGDGAGFLLLGTARSARPFTVKNAGPDPVSAKAIEKTPGFPVDPRDLSDGGWTLCDTRRERLMEKICEGTTPLGEYVLGGIRYDPGTGPVLSGEQGRERIQFDGSAFPPHFVLSGKRAAFGPGTGVIPSGSQYLFGILTSPLAGFVFGCLAREGTPHEPTGELIARFPVAVPDFDLPADAARHGRLELLVAERQALLRQRSRARPEREREAIDREILSAGKQIDSLVYAIYGLSVDEIALVESLLP
jgi:Type I restriction-modification system methyltransferase subunit